MEIVHRFLVLILEESRVKRYGPTESQGKSCNIPIAHKPSNASHNIGLRAKAWRKLTDALSGRFPFKASVPDLQRKAASSGKAFAVLELVAAK